MTKDSDASSEESAKRTAVTIEDGLSQDSEDALRQRRPFVSRHRQALDRIKTDSTESRRYTVPHQRPRSASTDSNDLYGADLDALDAQQQQQQQQQGPPQEQAPSTAARFSRYVQSNMVLERKSCSKWLEVFLPMWSWLKVYKYKEYLNQDIMAGLTVGIMIIPQSMSYAKLAGLPVEFGLYSALFPVYAYAFFGSSRQLAVGPVALISLLLNSGLTTIMDGEGLVEGSPEYVERYNRLAIQCSFLVGVMYIFMGIFRLGFVTIFLSHAVVSGFTTGAAVIIGMSQVKYIVGYSVSGSKELHKLLQSIFSNIENFNWKTFLMGMSAIFCLLLLKNIGKTYPRFKWVRAVGPLAVTGASILLVFGLDLDEKGVPIVGDIPKGFPGLTISEWTPIEDFSKVFVVVISITIVGFMESIAIAKQLASKHKYEIDSSMELIGLGMANFAGGLFNGYPVTGSFSRSAVNNESGAQSGVSAMVTATMVGVVLLLLTPIFEIMPLNVLAAIVISGVLGLLDYPEAKYLWAVHKFDFGVWCVACFGTMFLGVEIGLAIAVGVSLLIVIYESAYPHTSVMGRLPGTTVYRNVKQYPEAERYDGIVLIRVDAPIYFANAQNVREKIRKYRKVAEEEMAERNGDVKFLIMELSPVSHMDTSALHVLEDMMVNYKSRGQQLCFSNPNMKVMEMMVLSGFADKVGRDHFFFSLHDAVNWCLHEMDCEATSQYESLQGSEALGPADLVEAALKKKEDGDVEAAQPAALPLNVER